MKKHIYISLTIMALADALMFWDYPAPVTFALLCAQASGLLIGWNCGAWQMLIDICRAVTQTKEERSIGIDTSHRHEL